MTSAGGGPAPSLSGEWQDPCTCFEGIGCSKNPQTKDSGPSRTHGGGPPPLRAQGPWAHGHPQPGRALCRRAERHCEADKNLPGAFLHLGVTSMVWMSKAPNSLNKFLKGPLRAHRVPKELHRALKGSKGPRRLHRAL